MAESARKALEVDAAALDVLRQLVHGDEHSGPRRIEVRLGGCSNLWHIYIIYIYIYVCLFF